MISVKFAIGAALFLFSLPTILIAEALTAKSIFVRAECGFDFKKEEVVDINKGDINITQYGIEGVSPDVEIAPLYEHFVEDIKELPQEEVIEWRSFADYEEGMVYAVKCSNAKFAIFELMNVKVSGNLVIGIDIRYKYQPDGTSNFN